MSSINIISVKKKLFMLRFGNLTSELDKHLERINKFSETEIIFSKQKLILPNGQKMKYLKKEKNMIKKVNKYFDEEWVMFNFIYETLKFHHHGEINKKLELEEESKPFNPVVDRFIRPKEYGICEGKNYSRKLNNLIDYIVYNELDIGITELRQMLKEHTINTIKQFYSENHFII